MEFEDHSEMDPAGDFLHTTEYTRRLSKRQRSMIQLSNWINSSLRVVLLTIECRIESEIGTSLAFSPNQDPQFSFSRVNTCTSPIPLKSFVNVPSKQTATTVQQNHQVEPIF